MEVPLEFANSCDQSIFLAKIFYCIETWKNTIAYAGVFKGIGTYMPPIP